MRDADGQHVVDDEQYDDVVAAVADEAAVAMIININIKRRRSIYLRSTYLVLYPTMLRSWYYFDLKLQSQAIERSERP